MKKFKIITLLLFILLSYKNNIFYNYKPNYIHRVYITDDYSLFIQELYVYDENTLEKYIFF